MKKQICAAAAILALAGAASPASAAEGKLKVVTTLTTWADLARRVGGDRVEAESLVPGNQDPHFVRPKPSLAEKLARADLFVSTGLDLELWADSVVDLSRNPEIRSGGRRYVSAAQGVSLLEVPKVLSQSEGDVHIYGNPHFMLSPPAVAQAALNIAAGLSKIDPGHAAEYAQNAKSFGEEMDERMVGKELLHILGPVVLHKLLAQPDKMIQVLQTRQYKGAPLIDKLGGWMAKAMPLRGRKVVAWHKDMSYFSNLFGLQVANYIEPKPGVPPRAEHVAEVVEQMRREKIRVIVAANYFDEGHVREIAGRVGAKAVIVPLFTEGSPEVRTYPELMDHLIGSLVRAFSETDAAAAAH
jgi:ABC-type Zn uptake system ZnuABC Zn-binding protein ZnuA